jgi:hypothetical protein
MFPGSRETQQITETNSPTALKFSLNHANQKSYYKYILIYYKYFE